SVVIGPMARVAGNMSAAGGEVRVLGPVTGYVSVAAGRAFIDAPIGGDVDVRAGRLELGPKAVITGRLRYASGAPLARDPAAQVIGGIERAESGGVREPERGAHSRGPMVWVWTAGLMLLAAVLGAVAPKGEGRIRDALRARPGVSMLAGFIALVCIPIAAVLLLVTVIGAPLALLTFLAYPALLLLGYVSVGVAAGTMALARWNRGFLDQPAWRATFAAGAVLLISLVTRLPWIGGLVAFVVLLAGVGAVLIAAHTAGRTSPAAA
ncbi:MAG TPA: polymer-forming cytoskeletal protein, partial [Burkholderiaceae bacterium]|nr:polymer-forming cytoskeletal protein [Burkholderiaceae bacterium]